jgi:hypothetical protein
MSDVRTAIEHAIDVERSNPPVDGSDSTVVAAVPS